MPTLEKLYQSLKGKVVFLFISYDEKPAVVSSFIGKNNFTMPVYLTDNLPSAYDADAVPTTFILSSDGRIVFKQSGAVDWSTQKTVDFLNSLVK